MCAPDSATPLTGDTSDKKHVPTYVLICMTLYPVRSTSMHTAPAKTQTQQALLRTNTTLALVDSLSSPPRPTITEARIHDLTPTRSRKKGLVRGQMLAKAIMREEGMHGVAWRRWTGTR
ncbi:uncharacterized protein N7525_010075 [Penicillium rubens]|uniref:uncharacterized protein n=1 Tax=Penicillium rubens TaxID=1108849 RepID=UPI002A5998AA|nr:uncharacterized protein N7525_010075 [Penicillium rubens]KAJ5820791.1 hypothetical protein N7525_010075 [Penicillium rubens]KAJ5858435.1 hypothetical protein N7534_003712 [Penicillium rubens]